MQDTQEFKPNKYEYNIEKEAVGKVIDYVKGEPNKNKVEKQIAGEAIKYLHNVAINKLSERPDKINRLIDKYGNNKIIEINICRTPIQTFNKILLHFATFGTLTQKQKEYNYDDIFHLYTNIKLDNGLIIGMEKNERINLVKDGIPTNNKTQCIKLNTTNKNLSLADFIINGEKVGGANFWRYDFHTNNCQKWIHDLLLGSHIKSLTKFVMQKIGDILKDVDLRSISDKVIDAYSLYAHYTEKKDDLTNDIKPELKPIPEPKLIPEPKPIPEPKTISEPKPISEPELTLEEKLEQKFKNSKTSRIPKHKKRKPNAWFDHLEKFRKKNPKMPYKEAFASAKLTYKK